MKTRALHKLTSFASLLMVLSLALSSCSKEDEVLDIEPIQVETCEAYIHTSGIPAVTELSIFWNEIGCGDTLNVMEYPGTVKLYMYTLRNPECSDVDYLTYRHGGKLYYYNSFTSPLIDEDIYSALIPESMIDEVEFIY
tara:strand:+ start:1208 stop:1624 length:417 start_codon:yes stop_codon:yes gene_type:complete